MEIPVPIEPVAKNGFRARSGEPLVQMAEGNSADEALQNLQEPLKHRLLAGGRIVPVLVSGMEPTLAEFAGMFKDDPYFDQVVQIMEKGRRQDDEGLGYDFGESGHSWC